MFNHLSVFKEIVSDLQSMEVDYDDEDLALILLCSLPSSFTNFRNTLLYSHDTLMPMRFLRLCKLRKR